jgi:serine/threonine protein kinase
MICPRCSVAEISPLTNRCELCGYGAEGAVAVEAPEADATDALARRELAHLFSLDALLGLSPTSATYLAREQENGLHIVLRAVRRTSGATDVDERFRRGAEQVQGLDHPHILPVLRFGMTEGVYWYTMEHVRSRSLRVVLATRGALDIRSVMRIVAQIASALDHGHRQGIVHGDLRPENVLIDPDGWVRVCDALVARIVQPAASGDTPRPVHVAPEDWAGGLRTPAADQYALAVLVHECLAGGPPFEAAALTPRPPLDATRLDLPPHVGHAVSRALMPHPADRFPSLLDFVAALEQPGRVTLPDARPSGKASALLTIPDWEPPEDARPRRSLPLWIVVLIAAVGFGIWGAPRLWNRPRMPYDAGPLPRRPAVTAPGTDSVPAAPAATAPGSTVTTPPAASSGSTVTARTIAPAAPHMASTAPPPGRTRPPRQSAPAATTATGEAGKLFVNATPWGQVSIDGQPVGNTPKANLSVAPGTHVVRVERDGYEPVERTVVVAAGQTVRLTDLVLTERHP